MLVVVYAGSAFAAPARPDLVAAAIAVSQQGPTLSVTNVVRNNGGVVAPRSTVVYTVGGVRIGARSIPPLRAGSTSRGSVRLVVPASVTPGSYRLVFHPPSPFFKRVELEVELAEGHYHVPLLVSPYSCASYRGS